MCLQDHPALLEARPPDAALAVYPEAASSLANQQLPCIRPDRPHSVTERDRLSQQLMDLEDQVEKERRGAAERSASLESELAEARKSERAALDRAARAEGEVTALREQLTQLTAVLRASPAVTGGKRRDNPNN